MEQQSDVCDCSALQTYTAENRRPLNLSFYTENGRRQTFSQCVQFPQDLNKEELVRWGFYLESNSSKCNTSEHHIRCAFCGVQCQLHLLTHIHQPNALKSIRPRHRSLPSDFKPYAPPPSIYAWHKHFNPMCPLVRGTIPSNVEFSTRALERSHGCEDDDEDFNPNRHKLLNYEFRLRSFTYFPNSALLNIQEMARWGLYYTGVRDIVRCIFCRIALYRWDRGDDPYQEHLKYQPDCPIIQGRALVDIPLPRLVSHEENKECPTEKQLHQGARTPDSGKYIIEGIA